MSAAQMTIFWDLAP